MSALFKFKMIRDNVDEHIYSLNLSITNNGKFIAINYGIDLYIPYDFNH